MKRKRMKREGKGKINAVSCKKYRINILFFYLYVFFVLCFMFCLLFSTMVLGLVAVKRHEMNQVGVEPTTFGS